MKCPTCPDATLTMAERQGVEIDYCPACRGVWLDRGELDKILERSTVASPAGQPSASRERPRATRTMRVAIMAAAMANARSRGCTTSSIDADWIPGRKQAPPP
ncbi:TFIIB-type zinc ribbon-containing protein [Cupriavidus sp. EM10]|nr:zf-TFIIB domain-containing protein [Cupriavidus sp. EM10]QWE96359.1 zf-TFIIB domain-containing protein [Cupriavidus sp. EM10]